MQTIRLWDPNVVAQVRPVGRETEEAVERLLPGEQVLITSTEAVVTPAPVVWRYVGPRGRRRWLLDGRERVRVEDDGVVWNGEPPPPPPAWANGVSVSLETAGSSFRSGQPSVSGSRCPRRGGHSRRLRRPATKFRQRLANTHVPGAGRAEMSGQCRLRVGATRGGESVVVQRG